MASIFGTDGGTITQSGLRRPTNAGYPTTDPAVPDDPFSPFGMPGTPQNPNTGFPGPTSGTPTQPPPSAPQQTYALQPYDPAKLASKHDPKYDFLRIAQHYDPRQGVQSGMINELNQLGYANFYGSGQHLGYNNVTDAGRQYGLNNDGFQGDFIQNWGNGQNPNAQWAWDWYEPPTTGASATPDLSSLFGPSAAPASNSTDMSWLGPLMQSILHGTGSQPPAPNPTTPMSAPPIGPSYSQPSPTFYGGYATPGYAPQGYGGGAGAQATSLMSMPLQQILSDPAMVNDPLVQQIRRLMGAQ